MIVPGEGHLVVTRRTVHSRETFDVCAIVVRAAGSGPDGWLVTTTNGQLFEVADEPVLHLPVITWLFIRAYP